MLTLLRLRPDLAAPAPQDINTLSSRVGVRTSLMRCLDALDAFAAHVLESLVVLDSPSCSPSAAGVVAGMDATVEQADILAAVERLYDRAVIWGSPRIRFVNGVRESLSPYPVGLGAPAAHLLGDVPSGLLLPVLVTLALPPAHQPVAGQQIAAVLADEQRLGTLLEACSPPARAILDQLAHDGTPVAMVSDAALRDDDAGAVRELITHALLVPIGPDAFELPREIGLHLRGERPLGWAQAHPPDCYTSVHPAQRLDATGSVAVLETLRLVDALAAYWTEEPPNQLRQGGLGVRDLRRTARHLGITEPTASLLAEVCVAADLIGAPMARDVPWRATTLYDKWTLREPAARWVALAQAWRTMSRLPHLAGQRDERGKARSVLSYELERSSAGGWRGQVLQPLLDAPAGAGGPREAVLSHLRWQLPRRMPAQEQATQAVLSEAEVLGLTAAGGLTSYARLLLDGDAIEAQRALHGVLPEPVDEFLLQPDLTAVVPGPPTPGLTRELGLLADLESAGGASVYRVTDKSMRRAFDAGRTAGSVHEFFAARSRTPVPQALTYLIDDLARRYGVLRAGPAQSYLRCDDTALLDRVVSDRDTAVLNWHRLAPTVALAATSPDHVLDVLRAAGYTPAGEDVTGGMQLIGSAPERARPRRHASRTAVASGPDAQQLGEIVRRMRTGDTLSRTAHRVSVGQNIPGVTSATTLGVLREAIRGTRRVWVSVADSAGTAGTHILEPMSLGGGFLRGFDVESGEFLSVALHRITSLNVL